MATIILLAITSPAFAQAPSQAQRDAIKTQCRSDYIAHCSSVPPGGEASLQCLQKNMSGLSSGCAGAVRAVEAPTAAPKAAEPTPAATPRTESTPPAAKPATVTAAPKAATMKQPSSAQIAAIRSACRGDYPKVCKGVPTGGAPALQCLETNKAKLSAGCEKAVSAVSGETPAAAEPAAAGTTAAPAAAATTGAPATAPAIIALRPMRPREELFVMRSACGGDIRSLCGGIAPGGGRIAQCLASNGASLSPACASVLAPFARR
ncbi:hypothetical protein [Tardiphaga sp.]|uniref:hypothetical protein n=1 Tax=Tardiphaga sp. TaxID=1926292 RepID=UPI002631D1CC|nr:hypothetical protein [Tardiphaga sp.]